MKKARKFSAKFRPDSRKRTSDSDSTTKNYWKSVKTRIDVIFDLNFVDQCYLLKILIFCDTFGGNTLLHPKEQCRFTAV